MPCPTSLAALTQLLAGGLVAEQQQQAAPPAQAPALASAPSLGLGLGPATSLALQPSGDLGLSALFAPCGDGDGAAPAAQQAAAAQQLSSKQGSCSAEDWMVWDTDWCLPALF